MSQDSDVVIYSNPFDNWGDEGRMFWMLEYLGHKSLRILDGGWVKWTAEKRPFEYGAVSPTPGNFTVNRCGPRSHCKDELKRLVKGRILRPPFSTRAALKNILGKKCPAFRGPGIFPPPYIVAWNGFLNTDATVKDLAVIRRRSWKKRVWSRARNHLLLYGRRPVGMALFCP